MTRLEQSIRSRLAVSIGMTLLGITCAIYGLELIGAVAAILGMALLIFSVHRFGRIGEDV